MAPQALYRRWRSRTFAEIIGQDHVTHTLLNALRAGRIGHAYLFAGPRGTGKTTTARVLAKAVNCLEPQDGEPCNHCNICRSLNDGRTLDLIEIDGASNTGVDDVRDLRDKIAFMPSECRYKVYVIDEVHMLSNAAFNALLKTLEEPPPHVIFVLATTEAHKIPLTVLSRCQRFDFRRVALADLKRKLELICSQEQIDIAPAALDAIARHATGSFRDAESLLDQLASYGTEEISPEDVRRVLGSAPEEVISGIVTALVSDDVSAGLRWINEALDQGVEPRQLTREILEYLRWLLLAKSGGGSRLAVTAEMLEDIVAQAEGFSLRRLLQTIRLFNQAANQQKTSVHVQLPLELAFVDATLLGEQVHQPGGGDGANRAEPVSTEPATSGGPGEGGAASRDVPESPQRPTPEEIDKESLKPGDPAGDAPPEAEPLPSDESGMTLAWLGEHWGALLRAIRPLSRPVEALLNSCEPVSVNGDLVTLGFYHGFHKERMDEGKNRQVVEDALRQISGRMYRVNATLRKGDREQSRGKTEEERRARLLKNPVVREAINRFGAKVVSVE
jgi:DNA polymerase-3 subunit gamma/tau